jgi:hypothetical protein
VHGHGAMALFRFSRQADLEYRRSECSAAVRGRASIPLVPRSPRRHNPAIPRPRSLRARTGSTAAPAPAPDPFQSGGAARSCPVSKRAPPLALPNRWMAAIAASPPCHITTLRSMSNLTVADSFPRSASAERQPIVHGFHESLRNFTVEREPGNVQTNELVYYDACGTPPSRQYDAFLPTNAAAALTGMP